MQDNAKTASGQRNIMQWMLSMLKGIAIAGDFISCIIIIGITVLVFINVVLRYIVKSPVYWGDEIMTWGMIIMIYAGVGLVLIDGGHIRMTLVFNRQSRKIQNILWIIVSTIGLGFGGYIFYAMVLYAQNTLKVGNFSNVTRWPLAPWHVAIAVLLIFLELAFLRVLIERILIARGDLQEKISDKVEKDFQ